MKKFYFILFSLTVIAFIGSLAPSMVKSEAAKHDVEGWFWSPQIGWISLNSSMTMSETPITPETPPEATFLGVNKAFAQTGADYKVQLNEAGSFSGYGWGENVGWVSFNGGADLIGCPSTQSPGANLLTGQVYGWVRVLSGVGRTDGWDGCIELAGSYHASPVTSGAEGVTFYRSTGVIQGYAWGGEGMGWLYVDAICRECRDTTPPMSATCQIASYTLNTDYSYKTLTLQAVITGGSGTGNIQWNVNSYRDIVDYIYGIEGAISGPAKFLYFGPISNVDTMTYSGIKAKITDLSDYSTIEIFCPSFTLKKDDSTTPTSPSASAKLLIGRTASSLATTDFVEPTSLFEKNRLPKSLKVKLGDGFGLRWNVNVPTDYTCTVGSKSGPFQSWGPITFMGTGADYSGTKEFNTTTVTGKYEFVLTCVKGTTVKQSTTTLDIVTSAIEEV